MGVCSGEIRIGSLQTGIGWVTLLNCSYGRLSILRARWFESANPLSSAKEESVLMFLNTVLFKVMTKGLRRFFLI